MNTNRNLKKRSFSRLYSQKRVVSAPLPTSEAINEKNPNLIHEWRVPGDHSRDNVESFFSGVKDFDNSVDGFGHFNRPLLKYKGRKMIVTTFLLSDENHALIKDGRLVYNEITLLTKLKLDITMLWL